MRSILFLILIYANTTVASNKHPIDIEMNKCLNNQEIYKTSEMNSCVIDARVAWDRELNSIYKKLLDALTDEGKEKLKISQRQWIKQRDLEFSFLKEMYNRQEFSGSMYSNIYQMDKLNIVKSRTLTLIKYSTRHRI